MSGARSWLRRLLGGDAPAEPSRPATPEERDVQRVLDELAPALALDGGAVELVEVRDGWVVLRWAGACRTCTLNAQTLGAAVEPRLRARLPWVEGVRAS